MRILYIFHDNDLYSGASMSALNNVKGLAETNDVTVLLPSLQGTLEEEFKRLGISVLKYHYCWLADTKEKSIYTRLLNKLKLFAKNVLFFIRFMIDSNEFFSLFDVVISNTSTISIGCLINKKYSIPHIWHFREFGEDDHNLQFLFGRHLFQHLCTNYTDACIVISNIMKDYYSNMLPNLEIHMIYNDLTSSYISNSKSANFKNIAVIGTISELKGQKEVLEAVKVLKDNNIHVNLFIAGKINEYAESLKEYVKSQELKNVSFCGFIQDMNNFLKDIGIVVVPSNSEAFGRVVIESMLSRTLVIGASAGAIPELVSNEETGLLYKKGDAKALAFCIEKVLYNEGKYCEMIEKAFSYSLQFTKGQAVQSIEELCNRVVIKE